MAGTVSPWRASGALLGVGVGRRPHSLRHDVLQRIETPPICKLLYFYLVVIIRLRFGLASASERKKPERV